MSFRPLSSKETPPKCRECGAGNPRVVSLEEARYEWLCAPCEYRREYPDAKPVPLAPAQRKPLLLQTQTLL